jgi:hypothetical protein
LIYFSTAKKQPKSAGKVAVLPLIAKKYYNARKRGTYTFFNKKATHSTVANSCERQKKGLLINKVVKQH